jgi:hypothetical protein
MNVHKTRLARLKQRLLEVKRQEAGQRCRCEGPCWIRDEASTEAPPERCWSCGGIDPPGVVLRFEIVETIETEERKQKCWNQHQSTPTRPRLCWAGSARTGKPGRTALIL